MKTIVKNRDRYLNFLAFNDAIGDRLFPFICFSRDYTFDECLLIFVEANHVEDALPLIQNLQGLEEVTDLHEELHDIILSVPFERKDTPRLFHYFSEGNVVLLKDKNWRN